MEKKLLFTIFSVVLIIVNLTGCNMDADNNLEPTDVNYRPVGDAPENDLNELNDRDLDMDNDLDINQDVREPNEFDTPFNMDEEEPDLDEEPSEEFRNGDNQ